MNKEPEYQEWELNNPKKEYEPLKDGVINIEQLLKDLFETSKTSKKTLCLLKNVSVMCQQFELASQLRGIERELYPETKEQQDAKELAAKIKWSLKMVNITANDKDCFSVYETIKILKKKKGDFSIKDAHSILEKAKIIFSEE